MKICKKLILILLAIGLSLTLAVPVTAGKSKGNGNSANPPEKAYDKWLKAHEMKLHYTKSVRYDGENIIIKEIYSGKELLQKYGKKKLRIEEKFPIPKKLAKERRLKRGVISKTSKYITTAVTTSNDPPQWWQNYNYPQWTWAKSGENYIRKDPINLAWYRSGITMSRVKDEINDGSFDEWSDNYDWSASDQYIYDKNSGWIEGDDMITGWEHAPAGPRYHIRLWTIYTGDVVAGAHHEDSDHDVDKPFERAEERVLDEFDDGIWPDLNSDVEYYWEVTANSYWLDNMTGEPGKPGYNNGWASEIW